MKDLDRIIKLLKKKFLLVECREEGGDIFVRFPNGGTNYYTARQAVELLAMFGL